MRTDAHTYIYVKGQPYMHHVTPPCNSVDAPTLQPYAPTLQPYAAQAGRHTAKGLLSMANSGRNSNSSQVS